MQGVTAIPVVDVAFPAGRAYLCVLIDELAEALEAPEEGGDLRAEVDEYLILFARILVVADENRRERAIAVVRQPVGEKALLPEGPEQAVEVARLLPVRDLDEDAVSIRMDAFHQAAGEEETIPPAGLFEGVEVDAGHTILSYWD